MQWVHWENFRLTQTHITSQTVSDSDSEKDRQIAHKQHRELDFDMLQACILFILHGKSSHAIDSIRALYSTISCQWNVCNFEHKFKKPMCESIWYSKEWNSHGQVEIQTNIMIRFNFVWFVRTRILCDKGNLKIHCVSLALHFVSL